MRPLIVAPMPREARAVGHGATICSRPDAARVIEAAHRANSIDVLLIAGVCGGLDPSLAPGDVILARAVTRIDGAELLPDGRLFATVRRSLRDGGARFVSSKLLSVDKPLDSRRERTQLWNTHGAGGIDMETYDITEVAARLGIPWIAIRAVVDPSSTRLPATLRAWRPETTDRQVVRSLAVRPWEWPAAARLAWQMRKACSGLRAAVDLAIPAIERLQAELLAIDLMPVGAPSARAELIAP